MHPIQSEFVRLASIPRAAREVIGVTAWLSGGGLVMGELVSEHDYWSMLGLSDSHASPSSPSDAGPLLRLRDALFFHGRTCLEHEELSVMWNEISSFQVVLVSRSIFVSLQNKVVVGQRALM